MDALHLQDFTLFRAVLILVSLSCFPNQKCWHLMFTLQLLKELLPAINAFPIRADTASSVCCFNSLRARVIKANSTESILCLSLKEYSAVSIWRAIIDVDIFDSLKKGNIMVGFISCSSEHHYVSTSLSVQKIPTSEWVSLAIFYYTERKTHTFR